MAQTVKVKTNFEYDAEVELPTDNEGSLLVETLTHAGFPGVVTLMYVDPDSGRTIRMQKDPTNTKFIRPTRGWENIEFVVSERRHTHEVLRPNDGNGLGVDFLRRHTQPTIYGNVHELEQQAQELAQFRRRSSHAIGFGIDQIVEARLSNEMMRYRVEQLERDSIHSQIRALQQNNATLLTQIQQTNATLQTQIQQGSSNYTANAGIIIAAISVVATTVFGLGGIILTIYLSKKS